MYWTAGYVDRETYVTKGHIWGYTMEVGNSLYYFWLILERKLESGRDWLEQICAKWFYYEMAMILGKADYEIQKELVRFCYVLKSENIRFQLESKPLLILSFEGNLFMSEGKRTNFYVIKEHIGIYLSYSVASLKLVKEQIEKNVACQEVIKSEEIGNGLKTIILKAISNGELKSGYFLIWEDKHVVSGR